MLAALARQLTPDATAVPDADLLDRFARTADAAAFELLVWRHGAMVWAAARRVLAPDAAAADDASQAAFAALARHAGRVRGGSVGPWLHRVAVRAALDLRAAGRGRHPLPELDPADPHPGPDVVAADREQRALLDAAVNALPERLRAAFVLCELEGRSNAEAAAALGCPVGTVESRLTRARQRLRAVLTARGVTPALVLGAALPASTRAALVNAARAPAAVNPLAARAVGGAGHFRTAIAAGLVLVAGFGLAAPQPPRPADPPAPKQSAPAAQPDAPPAAPGEPLARFGSSGMRHAGRVADVAYSPDGTRLASVGADRALRVWDAATGRAVCAVTRDDGAFNRVGFASGGKVVLAVGKAGRDGAADLWRVDAATGVVAAKVKLPLVAGADFDARLSPDGEAVALAAPARKEVAVADTTTGEARWSCDLPRGAVPTVLAFTADGSAVGIGTTAGSVVVMGAATGGNPREYPGGLAAVTAVAVTPYRVGAAFAGGGVAVFDRATRAEKWRSAVRADNGLAFTRDNKLLFRAAPAATASTLDADDGRLPNTCGVLGTFFDGMVNATCVALYTAPHHPDGDRVAFGLPGGGIGVFGLHADRQGKPLAPSADPPHPPTELRFTPDGKTLRGRAGDWYSWDVATGKQTRLTTQAWTGAEPLSPDGRLTARLLRYDAPPDRPDLNDGFLVEVRDAATGRYAHLLRGPRYGAVWYEFTPDGAGLLGAAPDGKLRIWDFATAAERVAIAGHPTPPRYRAFSADGKVLATATPNDPHEHRAVRVWDAATGKARGSFDPGVPVAGVALSRDGGRLAALAGANGDDRATVWDVATGKELARVTQGGPGGQVALSPDGTLLALAAANGREAAVFAVDGGTRRFAFRHAGAVTGLAFAPDGRTLAAASADVPVTLWDVTGGRR